MRLALAVLFAAAIAVGVGMVFLPAGVMTAGLEGLAGLYVHSYLSARREAVSASPRRPGS